jgi:Large eukaryotic DNA virus major capsid protein/Major capsid protein N-terminus
MQLVAYGAQDVYLTGQPKVTFFQAVYKRHTNFAMENIQQTVNGSPSNSGRVSVTIARNGDLVGNMYVRLQPTQVSSANLTSTNSNIDMNWVAERAIAAVELTIGGQRIDKHYQTWFRLYAECFLGESDKINYGKLASSSSPIADATNVNSVYLPLLFFFNRNPGLYLPLIALQYHEVRLDFDLTAYFTLYFGSSAQVFEVWANYVYLDTEERRRFAQKGHEYLIEQVQHTGGDSVTATGNPASQTIRLSFNHPVKELIWCYSNTTATAYNSMWNFSTSSANVNVTCASSPLYVPGALPHAAGAPRLFSNILANGTGTSVGAVSYTSNIYWVEEGSSNAAAGSFVLGIPAVEVGPLYNFKIVLNGQDRFKEQTGKYFNQYQPFVYHTGTPYPGIYVYSFALQPEEHQPTGTCNFSRIDNAQVAINMKSNYTTPLQKMFAVNYNILRIQSGMGGLAFSN